MAVNVKQWRFRLSKGISHNTDFYLNEGSLDDNELVRQFIDVVTSYERIDVKMYRMVSDGGGGNTNFLSLIADNKYLQGKWKSKEYVYVHSILLMPLDMCIYLVLLLVQSDDTKKYPILYWYVLRY